MIPDPYNKDLFSTAGRNRIQTWRLRDRTLFVEQNVEISASENNGSSYITALCYIYYLPGDQIVTDLIIGNSKGDIGLVTCSKFIILKKGAHKGMINNIIITDVIHDVGMIDKKKLMVVTTGEDEYVRFWDISFKLVSEFSVRMHFPEAGKAGVARKNLSIQSIDIYACQPPPTMKSGDQMTTGYDKDNVGYIYRSLCYYSARETEQL